jgi:Protein of unknown function (DUF1572)
MLPKSYIDDVIARFRELKKLADGAIAQITDEQLFTTLDKETNSIAISMKHIAGNMRSRWRDFLTTDGEKPDRNRDSEFEVYDGDDPISLRKMWEEGWNYLYDALQGLSAEDLTRTILIRNEPHTVYQAINRQLIHYGLHVGQIVFVAKHLASDHWKSLTIPRGKSQVFNRERGLEYTQPAGSASTHQGDEDES